MGWGILGDETMMNAVKTTAATVSYAWIVVWLTVASTNERVILAAAIAVVCSVASTIKEWRLSR
jgi:hypothetical protein